MAHFCGFIKLIFLLLMLERMMLEGSEARPLESRTAAASSDLIAGNEFLKLFMDREELENDYYNKPLSTAAGGGGGGGGRGNVGVDAEINTEAFNNNNNQEFDKKSAETGKSRQQASRSLKAKTAKVNQAEGQLENSKHLGGSSFSTLPASKSVYLDEDYEEKNDAILDAEARDIDLKRERFKNHDDFKVLNAAAVVAASSASQQRATNNRIATTTSRYDNKSYTSTKSIVAMTPRPPAVTTTSKPSSSLSTNSNPLATLTGDNFINRTPNKSEEGSEPSNAKPKQQPQRLVRRKLQPNKSRKTYIRHRPYHHTIKSVADTLEALDSENSESTNVQNILASPLQSAASALRSMSTVTTTFHSGQRNLSINHDIHTNSHTSHNADDDGDGDSLTPAAAAGAAGVDEQLLPFQTVIYHDTKNGGHGPQSRSISYSSISQNVEDLKKWHQTGILAEARRNVSESLKIVHPHQSEPSKFYSQPSKMYSEPSKFYSEPAKVYSEPSKVYGAPEKVYSEPSKMYGEPSKFYSEPSKVYSQPSKVYSEPAKSYWPLTTSSTTTIAPAAFDAPPTNAPDIITTTSNPNGYQISRKPAIVSRIAFGEAASSTTTTSTAATTTTKANTLTTTTTVKPFSSYQHRTYGHHHQQPTAVGSAGSSFSSASSSADRINENTSSVTPSSRRILFNLDRLPYDLLNAPQPQSGLQQHQHHQHQNQHQHHQQQQQQQQHHLGLPNNQRSQPQPQTFPYQPQQIALSQPQPQPPPQQQQQQQQQPLHHNINPCLESAVSSLFSSSKLSAHPAVIQQQRQQQQQQQQQSSLSDQQHSNQNAKGLPNGDLVRCVAAIPATVSSNDRPDEDGGGGGAQFTTERSNVAELFTPTPEQNYEIEESVSVMTNGRVHGIHSGGRNSLQQLATTTLVPPPLAAQVFKPNSQRIHFGTNYDDNDGDDDDAGVGGEDTIPGGHLTHSTSYNNNNANANRNLQNGGGGDGSSNSGLDYGGGGGDYDEENNNNNDEDDDQYSDNDDDDGNVRHKGRINGGGGGGGDEEDDKVAYVVEGRNFRKYRVEKKTDSGFIVGEYGVVTHNDGNLRGVRYTADSTINRSLIQKALLTFLKLK